MEKRILFIAHDALAYGPNQSLINIISSLKSHGIFVSVVFPQEGVICDICRSRGWNYHIINFRNELRPQVNNFGGLVKDVLRFGYKTYLNKKALKKLIRLVEIQEINIIHTNSAVVSIGQSLSKQTGVNHVWHLREFIHPNYGLFVYGGLERYKEKIRKSKNLLCITNSVSREFGVEDKAVILHDAIRKKPKYTVPQSKSNYFLFCGSLHKNKGIEEAILAFQNVSIFYPTYKLLIVGEGTFEYENYLKDTFKELVIEGKIQFLGFRDDIDELMSKALALLMCSRNEALGRVTIEAMLNFCVVLGYNDAGTSELIKSRKTGLLYNDPETLVSLMTEFIKDIDQFDEIRDNAYNYAMSNFLEESFGEKLLRYYNSLK